MVVRGTIKVSADRKNPRIAEGRCCKLLYCEHLAKELWSKEHSGNDAMDFSLKSQTFMYEMEIKVQGNRQ